MTGAQTNSQITIYTDGSCHTQKKVGAWAAIVFVGQEKTLLSGRVLDTTHHRMELQAVIEAIHYVKEHIVGALDIKVITDSQYVAGLPGRRNKLEEKNFTTHRGNKIQNMDLVQQVLEMGEQFNIEFIKIKAHQKIEDENNYNAEVDRLSRKIVREG